MYLYYHFIKLVREVSIYILKNNSFVLFLYNSFFRLKNKRRFYHEVKRRSRISIFDYTELTKPIPFYPIESIKDSNFYGHFHSLKIYSNTRKIDHSIEHGLYLGNYVPKAAFFKTTESIITLSENRKRHLLDSGVRKPIFPIGPYIHYAESILEEKERRKLKEKLGKTLLVFPSHSIENFNVRVDIEDFISEISRVSKNYQTVMVCLFYKDILDERHLDAYLKYGYKIVSAGHRYDLNFISRLKSIIMLSDFTISNNAGTHVGYCIYLNKPHYIFNQDINYIDDKGSEPINYRNTDQLMSLEDEKEEIINAFSKLSTEISEVQKNVVDKFWGTSSIKSPKEIKELIK